MDEEDPPACELPQDSVVGSSGRVGVREGCPEWIMFGSMQKGDKERGPGGRRMQREEASRRLSIVVKYTYIYCWNHV